VLELVAAAVAEEVILVAAPVVAFGAVAGLVLAPIVVVCGAPADVIVGAVGDPVCRKSVQT